MIGRKGSSFDVLFLIFIVIIMAISGFVLRNVWDDIYNPTTSGNVFNQSSQAATIGRSTNSFVGLLDFIVPTILFFGIVIIAVLAYSNPIPAPFLIFGVLFTAILMYFALVFKEAYIDMVTNSATFTSISASFPITDLILRSFSMYILFLYALIVIIQYGRRDAAAL
jgi:hypothetical protein